jgi:hypothetical protein
VFLSCWQIEFFCQSYSSDYVCQVLNEGEKVVKYVTNFEEKVTTDKRQANSRQARNSFNFQEQFSKVIPIDHFLKTNQ